MTGWISFLTGDYYEGDRANLKDIPSDKPQSVIDSQIKSQRIADISSTDLSMVRVVDDLVVMLIDKKIIKEDDLPKVVLTKIKNREKLRKLIQAKS